MSCAKPFLYLLTLIPVAALNAAAQSGLNNPTPYSVPDIGAVTYTTAGSGNPTVGYPRVQPNAGSTTPAGYLVFSYRTNGVLVSEASVPESSPISSRRLYSHVGGFCPNCGMGKTANTGVAIVNPNSTTVTVSFYFSDANRQSFGSGSFSMAANSQIATFVNQPPFNGGTMNGTMTFSSTLPVGVIALQGLTNERGEFLMTTLPVTNLTVPPSSDALFSPLGATARFMKQFPGFESMPYPFRGEVRISTVASEGMAVIGLIDSCPDRQQI